MAKEDFNSASSANSKAAAFSSGFVKKDKHGRDIKTEEDIKTARIRTADGGYMVVRAGKPIAMEAAPEKKDQADKKAALTSSEDRRNQRAKADLDKKAKNFQL